MTYEHDGCTGCKHLGKGEGVHPCAECKGTATPDTADYTERPDMYEPVCKPTPSKRATILREAEHCICGQREQDYGSPESNFGIIANLWSDYLDAEITALDVAMMMVLLKVARIKNGGGSGDSFVDIAGYAACAGEIHMTAGTASRI